MGIVVMITSGGDGCSLFVRVSMDDTKFLP